MKCAECQSYLTGLMMTLWSGCVSARVVSGGLMVTMRPGLGSLHPASLAHLILTPPSQSEAGAGDNWPIRGREPASHPRPTSHSSWQGPAEDTSTSVLSPAWSGWHQAWTLIGQSPPARPLIGPRVPGPCPWSLATPGLLASHSLHPWSWALWSLWALDIIPSLCITQHG